MSAMMLGAFILSVGLTACNNDSEKKETIKDSMTVKTTDTIKVLIPVDTTKKDTSMKDVRKPIHNP